MRIIISPLSHSWLF